MHDLDQVRLVGHHLRVHSSTHQPFANQMLGLHRIQERE